MNLGRSDHHCARPLWVILAITLVTTTAGAGTLDFSWSPSSPDTGDVLTFRIAGVDGPLTWASWDFGGPACPGTGFFQQDICTPGLYTDCFAQAYSYSGDGVMTVTLSVDIDGAVIGPVTKLVTVGSNGSCGSPSSLVFADGFEGGSLGDWSASLP